MKIYVDGSFNRFTGIGSWTFVTDNNFVKSGIIKDCNNAKNAEYEAMKQAMLYVKESGITNKCYLYTDLLLPHIQFKNKKGKKHSILVDSIFNRICKQQNVVIRWKKRRSNMQLKFVDTFAKYIRSKADQGINVTVSCVLEK